MFIVLCNKTSVLYVEPKAWHLTVMEIFACPHCDGTLIWTFIIVLGKWPTWHTNSFLCIYFYL